MRKPYRFSRKAKVSPVSTEFIVVNGSHVPSSDIRSSQYLVDCFIPEKPTKAFKDITGQTFGKITALKYIGIQKTFHIFLFRCECGKLFLNPSFNVTSGRTKSCGDLKHKPLRNDLTGLKIKRWTVMHHVPTDKNAIVYRCRCDCGTEKEVLYNSLMSKECVSCGCYQKERNSNSMIKIMGKPFIRFINRLRIVSQLNYSGRYSEINALIRALPYNDFVSHIKSQLVGEMKLENYGRGGFHIDHIIPISYAKTKEDAIYLCHYSNLRPLSEFDNSSKWNKLPENFTEDDFLNYKKSVDIDRAERGYMTVQEVLAIWDRPTIDNDDETVLEKILLDE